MNPEKLYDDLQKLQAECVRNLVSIDNIRSTDGFCEGSVRVMAQIVVLLKSNPKPKLLLSRLRKIETQWRTESLGDYAARPLYSKGALRTAVAAIKIIETHLKLEK